MFYAAVGTGFIILLQCVLQKKEINKKRKKEKSGLVVGLLSMILGEVFTSQINRNRVLSSGLGEDTVPQAVVLVSHKGILGFAVDSVSNNAWCHSWPPPFELQAMVVEKKNQLLQTASEKTQSSLDIMSH